jgi:dipeptidyl-peptidase-3
MEPNLNFVDERFADLQLLRYRLNGFSSLSLRQKKLVFFLAKAALYGRDITFDQHGAFNLPIRKTLEAVYLNPLTNRDDSQFEALEVYLKRLWFSNGIYHHYGSDKFQPGFDEPWLRQAVAVVPQEQLPLLPGETPERLVDRLSPALFDPDFLPKRVNQRDGDDLVATSACNFYERGISQHEAEQYYARQKAHCPTPQRPPSFGLNTTLVRGNDGQLREEPWHVGGRYGAAITHIVNWLRQASTVAENERQRRAIDLLVAYYETGDLQLFNDYCIEWVGEQEGSVDFINGFIEVYGDPLGLKGTWEGLVEYCDEEATRRTQTISRHAQWFEDHSPVDPRFRKPHVKGVSARAICAAMLGGDEYPATAIGINLPNADWIRAEYGSKSITISNITEAYNHAAQGSGFREEFVIDSDTLDLIRRYDDSCDSLHTDLHECLGHGSGQLLPGTDPDALKAYGSTIEEARADLFALYYIADPKLVELKLLPDTQAYRAQYYTYLMNGLLTQLTRLAPGTQIEEAHMRNRALIARWCLSQPGGAVRMVSRKGKTYVEIADYGLLRQHFATLLAEVQRIKSEGDYEGARQLVEQYGVSVDPTLHAEVLDRYKRLNLAPYKGFVNPRLVPVTDAQGEITDILTDYSEGYTQQMLRYSQQYATLI